MATSRAAFHEDQTLCTQLLSTITATIPLQILPSKITGAGSGLFVTKDVNYGEEIFRSDPIVNCVGDGMQSHVCDNCYAYQGSVVNSSGRFRAAEEEPKLELNACSGCKVCYYCSKTCQRKAWKRYHKLECAMLSETPELYSRTRALYRLLNIQRQQLLSREQWAGLQRLEPHVKEHLSSANTEAVINAPQMARFRTGTDLSPGEVLNLYCILLTNTVGIYQEERSMLGVSLDCVTSLMNHSCDPTAFVVFQGNTICVRSLRKLSAGEEVTQCYADVDMDVLIRRQMLKSQYFFDCCCERCEQQMQTYENRFSGKIEKIKQSQQQLIEYINNLISISNVKSFEIDAQNIAKHAFPGGDWPDGLEPWPTMHIRFAEIFRAHDRWVDALMQSVRGYLSLERRIGDKWVTHLFRFLQIISTVLTLPKRDTPCGKPSFPTEAQMWDILYGYLHELTACATKIFGARAKYTQAIQAWYSEFMMSADAPHPGTRAFARRFKKAQSKLLLWAGVDESRGIALA